LFQTSESLSFSEFKESQPGETASLPRHRWYPVPQDLPPELVIKAIHYAECSADDIVLDPFVGGGTVSVVASQMGLQSIGVDINPFLLMATSAKIVNIDSEQFAAVAASFMRALKKRIKREQHSKKNIFIQKNKKISIPKQCLMNEFWQKTFFFNRQFKECLLLALISAAKDAGILRHYKYMGLVRSNLSLDANEENNFLYFFERRVEMMTKDLREFPLQGRGLFFCADARNPLRFKNSFKLCVTSPPYLSSVDYVDAYNAELYFGRFISSKKELERLRKKQLTQQQHKKIFVKRNDRYIAELLIDYISRLSSYEYHRVQNYCCDLLRVLRNLKYQAKPDAVVFFLMSNWWAEKTEVRLDQLCAHLGVVCGWKVKQISCLRQLNEKTLKAINEYIIVFKNVS
jgi:DNA modification methylase